MLVTELLQGKALRIGDVELKLIKIKGGRKAVLLIKAPEGKIIERLDNYWVKPDVEAPDGLRIVEE